MQGRRRHRRNNPDRHISSWGLHAKGGNQNCDHNESSEAELHNIRATPTFVIGASRNDGKHHGDIVEGTLPWPQFKALIDLQLEVQKGR